MVLCLTRREAPKEHREQLPLTLVAPFFWTLSQETESGGIEISFMNFKRRYKPQSGG